MKIFLISKKMLALFLAVVGCAVFLLIAGTGGTVDVFSEAEGERLLPIYNVDRGGEKICSLTFDAAWDDVDTDQLIEILDKYNVKATFFMVGSWVQKYPESVKKFADHGHEIMNHSDTHPHIDQLSAQKVSEEISACADKIEAVTGKRPTLFRGPYGEYNNTVIRAAKEQGHRVLQWDVDSLDWKDLKPEDIITRVLKRVQSGSVILFHNGAKNTPAALPEIIERLLADGYKIVPATELLLPEPSMIDHKGTQLRTSKDDEVKSMREDTVPPTEVPSQEPIQEEDLEEQEE